MTRREKLFIVMGKTFALLVEIGRSAARSVAANQFAGASGGAIAADRTNSAILSFRSDQVRSVYSRGGRSPPTAPAIPDPEECLGGFEAGP